MAVSHPEDYLQAQPLSVLTTAPPDLRIINSVHQTLPTGRTPEKYYPHERLTYTKTLRRGRFDLPSPGIFDATTGYLTMNAHTNIALVGGPPPAAYTTYARFMNMFATCIYRLTLYQGTRPVAEIIDYGQKLALELKHNTDYVYLANHDVELGIGSASQRAFWSNGPAGPDRTYIVPINFGPFKRPWNMGVLAQRGPMYLEFEFYPAETCLECDAATTAAGLYDYRISNLELVMDRLPTIPQRYLSAYNNLVGGSWAELECTITEHEITAVNVADIQIPVTCSSLQKIMFGQAPVAQKVTASIDDRLTRFQYNNLTRFRFRINNVDMPHDAVDCTSANNFAEAYLHYKKCSNIQRLDLKMYDSKINITRDQFYSATGDDFWAGYSFEANHAPTELNPVSVTDKNNMTLHLEWAAPVTTHLYCFVYHWVVYAINADGMIVAGK